VRAHLRTSSVSILAGLVVLAVAVPGTALAKGPADARVDGPGLAQPLVLGWDSDGPELTALIDATGFWQLSEAAVPTARADDLGDRYLVSYTVHDEVGAQAALALHAYPFATPDPLVYVPAGQAYPLGIVPEGWRTSTAALTTWFETTAPSQPAVTSAADLATRSEEQAAVPGSSTIPWLLGGVALLVIMRVLRRHGDARSS